MQGNLNARQFASSVPRVTDKFKRLNTRAYVIKSIYDIHDQSATGAKPYVRNSEQIARYLIEMPDHPSPDEAKCTHSIQLIRRADAYDPDKANSAAYYASSRATCSNQHVL